MNDIHQNTLYKKTAFTLAEVLVTLTIIGVIASLTIPGLIQNVNNSENKVAWKKAFSELSQAMNRVMAGNGGSLKNVCGDSDSECLMNQFKPYLSYTKSCATADGCSWHAINKWYYMNGTSVPFAAIGAGIILNSGTLITFRHISSNCTWDQGDGFPLCGYTFVDVNGYKGPNTFGKDIFTFNYADNRLKPAGLTGDYDDGIPSHGCAPDKMGFTCSALYLRQ